MQEESDSGEFYITLEKDPQQEDFLQGRMLGNPYSSNDPGMGPLMRDIKNKICQDCELVALLEDDSGMELLVNNKIINLDLSVKDVYRKVAYLLLYFAFNFCIFFFLYIAYTYFKFLATTLTSKNSSIYLLM